MGTHRAVLPISLRWFAGLIAAVCWVALALQLQLIVIQATGMGVRWPYAVLIYLFFLTIQVNLLAAIATSFAAAGIARWPARGRMQSALAIYLMSAGLVFLVMLRPVFNHTGLQLLADALLHYVVPILYGLYWLVAVRKDNLRWRDAVIWLVYPALYLPVMLVFDLWAGFAHYPIIDLKQLTTAKLIVNIVASSCIFIAMSFAIVAIGRYLVRRRQVF